MQCRIKVVTKNGKSYNGPVTEYTLSYSARQEIELKEKLSNDAAVIAISTDDMNWWLIPSREVSVVHLAVWDEMNQLPLGEPNG